jgi:kynureninase
MASAIEPLTQDRITQAQVEQFDRADGLAPVRQRFSLPPNTLYLDGNSLGAMPRQVLASMRQVLEHDWHTGLIRSWNDAGWFDAPVRVGARLAPLIGAAPDEVIVADSTSINLFKALACALQLRPSRAQVLIEADDFPTNGYIATEACRLFQRTLVSVQDKDLLNRIDEQVAVLVLTHVNYRTGRMHDLEGITQRAHELGALVIWDLCHTAGAMPCALSAHEVDFAVGCGYKYLNGGPGAPAFIYAARRHHASMSQPLAGWMGHRTPFAFAPHYEPAEGMRRMLAGTPAILSTQALEAALTAFEGVDLHAVRVKGVALTDLFIRLVDQELSGLGVAVLSPRAASERGSQVCLRHEQAYPVMQALISRGVIGDVRHPDILRFGFAPLYVQYLDVWNAISVLRDVLRDQAYLDPVHQHRKPVT